jgi:vancomycin resistance protein YoaR
VINLEVVTEPEQPGRRVDRVAMQDAVLKAATALTPTEMPVATETVKPRITTAGLVASQTVATTILGDVVSIELDDRRWTVTSDQLAEPLVLPDDLERQQPTIDPRVLETLLAPIAEEVNTPPQDATVAWDGGLYAMSESHAGVEVDLARLSSDVAAALGAERTVALPLNSIPATVDTAHLDALGITEYLASGSSTFTGSAEARATNVAVAAHHLSQALIPLGPITLDAGYVEGKIISGDWFESDLGVGVCQVSTTVYRAALLAGLSFLEWHPHSFRLGFYELNGWPPVMDATIYQPNTADEWKLDLRFVNPTDGWMLLQMTIEGDLVTATLYGTPTDYAVEVGEPILGEPIPVQEAIERPTSTLTAGERVQVQRVVEGVEVALTRRVFSAVEPIAEDMFVSPYKPQPAVFLVGTAAEG